MSAIKVGDLVVVAWPAPCCGNTEFVGYTFIAGDVVQPKDLHCFYCAAPREGLGVKWPIGGAISVLRLQKLRGPKQPESVEREVTA